MSYQQDRPNSQLNHHIIQIKLQNERLTYRRNYKLIKSIKSAGAK